MKNSYVYKLHINSSNQQSKDVTAFPKLIDVFSVISPC